MSESAQSEAPPRWMSVSEAAVALGVGAPTVRRWIHGGHLKAVQPGGDGGVLRIPAEELHRLEEGTR